ncbi:MAG TPA: hypothetical protein V6C58_10170 [Allocoleopsis sp.]
MEKLDNTYKFTDVLLESYANSNYKEYSVLFSTNLDLSDSNKRKKNIYVNENITLDKYFLRQFGRGDLIVGFYNNNEYTVKLLVSIDNISTLSNNYYNFWIDLQPGFTYALPIIDDFDKQSLAYSYIPSINMKFQSIYFSIDQNTEYNSYKNVDVIYAALDQTSRRFLAQNRFKFSSHDIYVEDYHDHTMFYMENGFLNILI